MGNDQSLRISDRRSKRQIFKAVSSNAIGAFSFGIFEYGMGFMLLRATHSPLSFGMNLVVAPLVSILFFIPIGNFVDTHDHKKIIFWGYGLRLLGFLLLGIALPHFKGVSLLIPVAIFIAFDSFLVNMRNTAYSASVRQLVSKSYIPQLSSLTTACTSASRILAPVLGVILYSLLSIEGLIAIEVVATMIALGLMMSLKFFDVETSDDDNDDRKSQLQQFKETIQYMKKRPFVRDTIIAELVVNFFFTAVVTGSPFIVVNELNLSNQTVAIIETGFSIGYLLGSLVTGLLKSQRHFALKILGTLFIVGLSIIGMGISFMLARSAFMVGMLGLMFSLVMDLAFAIFDLAIEIRLQSTVDTKILGRVSSTLYSTSFAIMPIGTLVYTGLFSLFSNGSLIFIISGSLVVLYTILSFKVFTQDIKKDDQFVSVHQD